MVKLSKGMPRSAVGRFAERTLGSTAGVTGVEAGGAYPETMPPAVTCSLVHTNSSETHGGGCVNRESNPIEDKMLLSRCCAHPGEVFTHL